MADFSAYFLDLGGTLVALNGDEIACDQQGCVILLPEQVNELVGGAIEDYRICMHHPEAGCDCRKPQPGMVLDLAAAHGVDLSRAVMIGDAVSDERCAQAAGVGTFSWAHEFFGQERGS